MPLTAYLQNLQAAGIFPIHAWQRACHLSVINTCCYEILKAAMQCSKISTDKRWSELFCWMAVLLIFAASAKKNVASRWHITKKKKFSVDFCAATSYLLALPNLSMCSRVIIRYPRQRNPCCYVHIPLLTSDMLNVVHFHGYVLHSGHKFTSECKSPSSNAVVSDNKQGPAHTCYEPLHNDFFEANMVCWFPASL